MTKTAAPKPMTSGQCTTATLVAAGRQRSTCDPARWHGLCRLDPCACDCHTAIAELVRANPAIGVTVDPAATLAELNGDRPLPGQVADMVTLADEAIAADGPIVGPILGIPHEAIVGGPLIEGAGGVVTGSTRVQFVPTGADRYFAERAKEPGYVEHYDAARQAVIDDVVSSLF